MAVSMYLGMELVPRMWPEQGDKMTFRGTSSWPGILDSALKAGFVDGEVYTVVESYIGRSDHQVEFEEIPGKFNGSLFEHVPGPRRDEVVAASPWRLHFS